MFKTQRIYCQTNYITGSQQWTFDTREGMNCFYDNKIDAERALAEFTKFSAKNGIDGGRGMQKTATNINKLALARLDSCIQDQMDDTTMHNQSRFRASFDEKVPTIQEIYRL